MATPIETIASAARRFRERTTTVVNRVLEQTGRTVPGLSIAPGPGGPSSREAPGLKELLVSPDYHRGMKLPDTPSIAGVTFRNRAGDLAARLRSIGTIRTDRGTIMPGSIDVAGRDPSRREPGT